MEAAYSHFLPDILAAKTMFVRYKRTGKPLPAPCPVAYMPDHNGKTAPFHDPQIGNSVILLSH